MRRLGKFTINRELIHLRPTLVQLILRDIIIIKAEMLFHIDAIEYTGLSDHFKFIEDHELPLYYLAEYDSTDKTIIWVERDA